METLQAASYTEKPRALYNLINIVLMLSLKYLDWVKNPKEKRLLFQNAALEGGGGELAEGIYVSPAGTMS